MSMAHLSFAVVFGVAFDFSLGFISAREVTTLAIANVIARVNDAASNTQITGSPFWVKELSIGCDAGANETFQHFDVSEAYLPRPLEIFAGTMCQSVPNIRDQEVLDGAFYNGTLVRYGDWEARLNTDCYTVPMEEKDRVFMTEMLVTRPRICYITFE